MGYGLSSKQLVNLVEGCAQAKTVVPGQAMWTLDGDRTVQTTVVGVTAAKARAAVEVVTDHMTFIASPDLLLATPDGWTPKPFTFYSYRLEPHPTFLVNGHLVRESW